MALAGILLMLWSTALFAINGGKGLYAAGLLHYFATLVDGSLLWYQGGTPSADGDYFSDERFASWTINQLIRGSLGGVVFDNKLYCFFTTEDGVLQYVTVDASTGATTEPTLIDSDVPLRGAVAAVMGDVIYVFTTGGRVIRSSDGKFFSYGTGIQPSSVDRFLDAVTFYPPDAANQANRKIMLVFLDDQQMPYMTQYVPGTFDLTVKLPYSQDVVLEPLEFANLLLGTHPGDAKVPSIQLFGFADVYRYDVLNDTSDTQFYRWQYNESSKT
jgi:hypothetical protein